MTLQIVTIFLQESPQCPVNFYSITLGTSQKMEHLNFFLLGVHKVLELLFHTAYKMASRRQLHSQGLVIESS